MQKVTVAIAGFGGVGRATAELLLSRRARYREVHGADVQLVAVCGSRAGLAGPQGLEADQLTSLQEGLTGPEFIAQSQADILIEAGPTNFRTGGPGLAYIEAALSAGRDTIVISKGALVHRGAHLRQIAQQTGALLKLSGAAAAALPTIDLLQTSLSGSRVLRLDGILNATTNVLLDAMTVRGLGFDAALAEAQANGIAEADPRNDIEGWDTACKLLLIANFGLGATLTMAEVSVDGLHSLTPAQIDDWRARGVVPKLVGSLTREKERFRAEVKIRTYPPDDPFARVSGKAKAIRIITDAMGETLAISDAAEPLATAAAALKDLEQILAARST
ncbi:MAG: homoserine dehydrogenase [Salipiger marinus]|uniref:homoserine dehydrogenase n=1 Tax=Salipiger marinus TaxID=555512 RepID=UPI004059ECB3